MFRRRSHTCTTAQGNERRSRYRPISKQQHLAVSIWRDGRMHEGSIILVAPYEWLALQQEADRELRVRYLSESWILATHRRVPRV